jgi:hypothetical protein
MTRRQADCADFSEPIFAFFLETVAAPTAHRALCDFSCIQRVINDPERAGGTRRDGEVASMGNHGASDLVAGGVQAWRLPGDERGPGAARGLLQQVMAELGLNRELIGDGSLAVSETVTNAVRHGRPVLDHRPPTAPELWVWARTVPSPQLVVSVFDPARSVLPRPSGAGVLDEHGKGLDLLSAFTAEWGSARTRSRLARTPTCGKAVWFALPLPASWPGRNLRVHPGAAAQCLLLSVMRRGFRGTHRTDGFGTSVLMLPGLNVWVHPGHFCWPTKPCRYVRRPLVDVQETAEHLVRRLDATTPPPSSGPDDCSAPRG